MLCVLAIAMDFVRWILLLVFRDGMHAYYYDESQRVDTRPVVNRRRRFDFLRLGHVVQPSQGMDPVTRLWSIFTLSHLARRPRFSFLFFLPMIWGNANANMHWQRFVFIWQILFYFFVGLAWLPVLGAYFQGFVYSSAQDLFIEVPPSANASNIPPPRQMRHEMRRVEHPRAGTFEQIDSPKEIRSPKDRRDETTELLANSGLAESTVSVGTPAAFLTPPTGSVEESQLLAIQPLTL